MILLVQSAIWLLNNCYLVLVFQCSMDLVLLSNSGPSKTQPQQVIVNSPSVVLDGCTSVELQNGQGNKAGERDDLSKLGRFLCGPGAGTIVSGSPLSARPPNGEHVHRLIGLLQSVQYIARYLNR